MFATIQKIFHKLYSLSGGYNSDENPKSIRIYAIINNDSSLIDIAPIAPGSNICTTNVKRLSKAIIRLPSLFIKQTNHIFHHGSISNSLRNFIRNHPQSQHTQLFSMSNHLTDPTGTQLLDPSLLPWRNCIVF